MERAIIARNRFIYFVYIFKLLAAKVQNSSRRNILLYIF